MHKYKNALIRVSLPTMDVRENASSIFLYYCSFYSISLPCSLPDNSRLVKGPSAPSKPHLPFFFSSSSSSSSLPLSSLSLPVSRLCCRSKCSYWGTVGNSVCVRTWGRKGNKWNREKENRWEGKTLCLGLMKYCRYIDRFCGAKSFLCLSLGLLLFVSASLRSCLTLSISVAN